jgi:hypothetical protein
MGASGFLSSVEVDRFLSFTPPEVRDIVLELRSLVSSVCPNVTERILWRGLSYHDPVKGGPVKGAICQIEFERKHVQISFIHGVRLSDPNSMLVGDQLSKRHLPIISYERAPWDDIRGFIEEAAALVPSKFSSLPSVMILDFPIPCEGE